MLAIISGRVAFLAPEIGMVPDSGRPPTMRMRSMPRSCPNTTPAGPGAPAPPARPQKTGLSVGYPWACRGAISSTNPAESWGAPVPSAPTCDRPRACDFRRLRFSRSAARSRSLRAPKSALGGAACRSRVNPRSVRPAAGRPDATFALFASRHAATDKASPRRRQGQAPAGRMARHPAVDRIFADHFTDAAVAQW